jgi:hypothetical protein
MRTSASAPIEFPSEWASITRNLKLWSVERGCRRDAARGFVRPEAVLLPSECSIVMAMIDAITESLAPVYHHGAVP